MKKMYFLMIMLMIINLPLLAQQRYDKGEFQKRKKGFWTEIEKSVNTFNNPQKPDRQSFKMDFDGIDLPTSLKQFKKVDYLPPMSQGWTGTCWSWSTTSFFESEMMRLHGTKVRLSPIYTAYWEYVEKAKGYVNSRGTSVFGEGSEANAVMKIWKKYGVVPMDVYTGLQPNQKFHDHHLMFKEMETYLKSVKASNSWNEEEVVNTIRSIMNHYLGTPPESFKYKGKTYTPMQFFKKVVKLNPDDYVEFMSLKMAPYYEYAEYKVPDNWWHSKDYLNVPLDDFMSVMKYAVRHGFSVCLGGDVSETGYDGWHKVGMIPTYDIPSEYIDENARQFRFSNETTTDDHGIHCVGYMTDKNGKDWYLIKDSGSGSRNVEPKGYYFYHEDYVKLKMMNIMVHKDAAREILKKIKK